MRWAMALLTPSSSATWLTRWPWGAAASISRTRRVCATAGTGTMHPRSSATHLSLAATQPRRGARHKLTPLSTGRDGPVGAAAARRIRGPASPLHPSGESLDEVALNKHEQNDWDYREHEGSRHHTR